jgi:hypothetical protein
MHNLAEKLSFVELVERLARLRRFLLSEHKSGDSATRDVISVFRWAVLGILRSLDQIPALLAADLPLDENDRISCARKMANAYAYFDEMHSRLSYVHGAWIAPEVYVFLGNVLEFMPADRRPPDVSVTLLNEYSFEEEDLASHARMLLSAEAINLDTIADRPSVSLPKIERDNPLYWANLVHECGHIDEEGIDGLLADGDLIPTGLEPDKREVLENWAAEFYCDLFAVKVLGPAYLASFAANALIAAGQDGGEYGSTSHPPDIVRVCLMQRELEKKGLRIPLAGELAEYRDVGRMFYLANEHRGELERLHLAIAPPEDAPDLQHIPPLTEFADRIVDRIDEVVRHERELVPGDFRETPHLARRLEQGVLIGSHPSHDALEQLRRQIPPADRQAALARSELEQVFAAASAVIQESRTSPWEIVNAGWLHKVQVLYPYAFSLFFTETGSIVERIEEFDSRLLATDEVLLKSIEVSRIHQLFG